MLRKIVDESMQKPANSCSFRVMESKFSDAPVIPGNPLINSEVKNQSVVKNKSNWTSS